MSDTGNNEPASPTGEGDSVNPGVIPMAVLAELRARATRIELAARTRVVAAKRKDTAFAIDSVYMRLSQEFVKWIDELSCQPDNPA